jgi:uncharacterized spore protein YtfJ
MEQIKTLFEAFRAKLSGFAMKDAVASKPLSAGNRHVIVLSEVTLAFGGGGGSGEASPNGKSPSKGQGGGSGGAAKASPVAVLVIDNGVVRVETLQG